MFIWPKRAEDFCCNNFQAKIQANQKVTKFMQTWFLRFFGAILEWPTFIIPLIDFFAQQKSSQYCRNVYKVNIAGGRSSFSSFSFLALFINGCVSCLFKHMTVFHSSIHHHQSKSRKLLIRAIMCAWVQNAHQVIHQQNVWFTILF